MPERVQLSRKRGYRKPENAVVVSRPSKWGNPFRIIPVEIDGFRFEVRGSLNLLGMHKTERAAREHAVELFELHTDPMGNFEYDEDQLAELRSKLAGKDLACWCPLDQPCHADVLLKIANTPTPVPTTNEGDTP